MSPSEIKPQESIAQHLEEVRRLLSRQRIVEGMVHRQDMPKHELVESLVHKQNLAELRQKLDTLDIRALAQVLHALPQPDRLSILELLAPERIGEALQQVPPSTREAVLPEMDRDQLAAILAGMDRDRLASFAARMPQPALDAIYAVLEEERQQELQASLTHMLHPSIGALKAFVLSSGRLVQLPSLTPEDLRRPDVVWVDMVNPSDEERELVQRAFRLELPEDEELLDLEESARCYADEHGLHISSFFLHKDAEVTSNVTVSFVFNAGRLLTIRQEELAVFRLFRLRARVQPGFVSSAQDILLAIYDVAVEYDADMLEEIYTELEPISQSVLNREEEMTDLRMGETVAKLAAYEDINGKVRLDLMDTRRALSFLLRSRTLSSEQEANLREILRDLESLNNHTGFLFDKINFLLDAVMGLINLAQNKIIKIFSIASVVFLPPTLVASVYGMNFQYMPELAQKWGYPWAIALMIVSGISPYLFFKRKGWL